jgi:predicted dehydrogenase
VDKPLALGLADCDAIERSTRGAGVMCMPAHHYRFQPAIRAARTAVASGSIGLPWAVQGEFIIAGGTAAWPLGELANFALYPVDAVRAITALEVRFVYATRGSFFSVDGNGAADGGRPNDTEDFAVLALTLDHGVIATTSVGRAPTVGHPSAYGGERRLRIMGSHGTLVVDAAKPALTVHGGGRTDNRYYGADSLRGLLDHFVACVRGTQQPELGPRDARAALEVTRAARIAADENRVVGLPLATDDA